MIRNNYKYLKISIDFFVVVYLYIFLFIDKNKQIKTYNNTYGLKKNYIQIQE